MEEVVNHIDTAAANWKPATIKKGIHLIQDKVVFVDKKVLRVKGSGEELTGKKIFIGCGARPAVPPLEGLKDTPYITYIEALRLTKTPRSMIVIGGGYIGTELAFFFHQMGVDVTLLDSKSNLADREDEEIAADFMKVFSSQIKVLTDVNITRVSYNGGIFRTEYGDEQRSKYIEAEQLLVTTGVKSNGDQLDVEKSGIELTDKGRIKVVPTFVPKHAIER